MNLSDYHRRRFYYFKGYNKYFDLPVLVLSSMSASFSMSTQAYLSRDDFSHYVLRRNPVSINKGIKLC